MIPASGIPRRTKLGWSKFGKLSNRLASGYTGVGSRPQGSPAINLQVEFPIPGEYTVTCEVENRFIGVGQGNTWAEAEIIWTAAGNSSRRVITVVDGSSITGVAQAVSVQLYDRSHSNAPIIDYDASILVTSGGRGTFKQPPFLDLGPTLVTPGTTVDLALPSNVGAHSVLVRVGTVSGTENVPEGLLMVTQDPFLAAVVKSSYDPRQYDWVPLIAGIGQLRFTSNAAIVRNHSFQAYLGIDG